MGWKNESMLTERSWSCDQDDRHALYFSQTNRLMTFELGKQHWGLSPSLWQGRISPPPPPPPPNAICMGKCSNSRFCRNSKWNLPPRGQNLLECLRSHYQDGHPCPCGKHPIKRILFQNQNDWWDDPCYFKGRPTLLPCAFIDNRFRLAQTYVSCERSSGLFYYELSLYSRGSFVVNCC